mgnify:CR=1 FL=1
MKCFEKVVYFLFSHLHNQVVIIASGNGLSSAYRRLIILCCYLFETRYLVVTFCLFADIPAYFEVDVIGRATLDRSALRSRPVTILLSVLSLLSSFRLFRLLYYRADRLVWSHLHDLVVGNRTGLRLKWLSLKPVRAAFPKLVVVIVSNQLKHYPTLGKGLRIRLALVTAACEVLMSSTFSLVFFVTRYLHALYQLLFGSESILFTVGQLCFAFTVAFAVIIWRYVEATLYLLVPLILYLVGAVYGAQYRILNRELNNAKAKLTVKSEHQQHLFSSLNLSRATSAYRHAHARLTVFLLRLNSSTISPIIAYYLHYNLPCHANFASILLFQPKTLVNVTAYYQTLFIQLLFLGAITMVVARLNHKIALSGPSLATILAHKGMLTTVGKNGLQTQTHCWANKMNSVWCQEQIKLSTYYEMVWRSEKELAFTVGKMGSPMNWSFVLEVSWFWIESAQSITVYYTFFLFSFLQLILLYSSFVLYFGNKFIRKERGY